MVAASKNETTTALVKAETAPLAHRSALVRPIAKPHEMVEAVNETHDLLKATLVEGRHYGVIPGTEKERNGAPPRKVLLKAGAEVIAIGFGCHAEYELIEKEVDHARVFRFPSQWEEAPRPWPKKEEADRLKEAGKGRWRKINDSFVWQVPGTGEEVCVGLYRYVFKARMVRFDGTVVGEGIGACSSLESKYRSRPHDVENTIVKMAQKRALLAATLNAFGLSDAFSQDIGDDDGVISGEIIESAPSPAREAVEATQAAMREAKASATDDSGEKRRRAAAWAYAYIAQLEKAANLPADAEDDVRKGALEAFKTIQEYEKNQNGIRFLATVDRRLHDGVKATEVSLEAHLHGLEFRPTDDDKVALAFLDETRPKANG